MITFRTREKADMNSSCSTTESRFRRRFRLGSWLLALACLLFATSLPAAQLDKPKGKGFASPQAAVSALVEAARRADAQALLAILGPDAKDIVFSGDSVEGRREAANFVRSYDEKHLLKMTSPTSASLMIDKDGWTFPIPIVKIDRQWYFDVEAGKEELINRRIGRNELTAIQVMQAYVNAQLEYASKDRDGDGILEFAQKIKSDPGQKNGLYWPVKEGEAPSPFGPLIARAASEGYQHSDAGPQPYHGYYFKIVTRQGPNAPGGAYDFVVNGNMILGFGMIAYPAKYGVSGIMTFAVNQQGVIYECDLGEKTAEIINKMAKYNPDEHEWRKVSDKYLDFD